MVRRQMLGSRAGGRVLSPRRTEAPCQPAGDRPVACGPGRGLVYAGRFVACGSARPGAAAHDVADGHRSPSLACAKRSSPTPPRSTSPSRRQVGAPHRGGPLTFARQLGADAFIERWSAWHTNSVHASRRRPVCGKPSARRISSNDPPSDAGAGAEVRQSPQAQRPRPMSAKLDGSRRFRCGTVAMLRRPVTVVERPIAGVIAFEERQRRSSRWSPSPQN